MARFVAPACHYAVVNPDPSPKSSPRGGELRFGRGRGLCTPYSNVAGAQEPLVSGATRFGPVGRRVASIVVDFDCIARRRAYCRDSRRVQETFALTDRGVRHPRQPYRHRATVHSPLDRTENRSIYATKSSGPSLIGPSASTASLTFSMVTAVLYAVSAGQVSVASPRTALKKFSRWGWWGEPLNCTGSL